MYVLISVTYTASVCDWQMAAETENCVTDAGKVKFSIRLINCVDNLTGIVISWLVALTETSTDLESVSAVGGRGLVFAARCCPLP